MSGDLRALYADDPQTYANNLRDYLRTNGAPLTAENLNRISLAVSQAMRGETPAVDMDQAVERAAAPRAAAPRATARRSSGTQAPQAPAQQNDAAPSDVRLDAGKDMPVDPTFTSLRELTMAVPAPGSDLREPTPPANARGDVTRGAQVAYDNANAAADAGVDARGGGGASARAAQDGNIARGGTIPRARRIDESDPTAGMFDTNAPGGRQANEEGVDQRGLGMALLSPIAAAAMLPAAGAAVPQLGVTLQRQLLERAAQQGMMRGGGNAASAVGRGPAPVPLPGGSGAVALPPPAATAMQPASALPRVTISGRSGAAVRDPYNPASDNAGRTALTRAMSSRAERNAGRRVSETAGRSRRDGAVNE